MHPKEIKHHLQQRQFGVGRFHPSCLQFMACIEGYTVLICIFAVCAGMFPMYTVSQVTSIERHFSLSSQQAGSMVGSSEIGFLTSSLITGHFLSTGHRPRILAVCIAIIGLGSLIMSVPGLYHLSERKEATSAENGMADNLCTSDRQPVLNASACAQTSDDGLSTSTVYGIFVAGMILNGIGSSCLWTLGLAYIDDNCSKKKSPRYLGECVEPFR